MELLLEGAPPAQVHQQHHWQHLKNTGPARPAQLASPASSRLYGLDLARCLGCLGVIWFHVVNPPFNGLGYYRMPFFTALLSYLMAQGVWKKAGGKPRGFLEFAGGRARRLLLPYVLCIFIYKITGAIFHGHSLPPLSLDMVMTGWGCTPLWYLPFAFVASLAAYVLARFLGGLRGKSQALCLLILAIGGASGSLLCKYSDEGMNWWSLWAPLIGTIPLGVGIAFMQRIGNWRLFLARTWWAFAILWCGFAMLAHAPRPDHPNWMGILSGLCLIVAGVGMPLKRFGHVWKYLANLTFGMYLAHAGILNSLSNPKFIAWEGGVPRFLVVAVLSVAVSAIVMQFRFGRFLLGIESVDRPGKRAARPFPAMPEAIAAA